jgi:hypothetical protein
VADQCKECLSTKCKCEQPCKVCGGDTKVFFNINFWAVHVCDFCAMTITKQQVASL